MTVENLRKGPRMAVQCSQDETNQGTETKPLAMTGQAHWRCLWWVLVSVFVANKSYTSDIFPKLQTNVGKSGRSNPGYPSLGGRNIFTSYNKLDDNLWPSALAVSSSLAVGLFLLGPGPLGLVREVVSRKIDWWRWLDCSYVTLALHSMT